MPRYARVARADQMAFEFLSMHKADLRVSPSAKLCSCKREQLWLQEC